MASNIDCEDPLSLTCKLCNQTYKHKDGPVMLQCLHSYCKQCLTEYIQNQDNTDNKITCPTCNDPFLPTKDANFDFPTNLRLSHLVELKTYQEQAVAGTVKCQTCEGTPKDATTFSCNRRKFFCDQCKSMMLKFRDDEDHKFTDLSKKEEFKINNRPSKCQEHDKHDLELYCNNCAILICSLCSSTEHDGHKRSSLGKISQIEKAHLQQLTNDGVDDALGAMDKTIPQIQEMRDKVKVSTKVATNRINKMCDDLILAVENRREVLKRRCQDISEGKDNVLSDQMIEIEQLRRNLGFAQLHAKDAISNHSDEEVLSVKKVIENRLNHTMEKYHQQSLELRENYTIDTSLEAKPLLEEIDKLGFFTNVPDISKCSVKGWKTSLAIIGKEKEIDIVLKDETGKPVEGKRYVQCELRKTDEVPDDYIPPKFTITQRNNGTTRLGFTQDQPGEYEMAIMVRNKPITDPLKITAVHPKEYTGFQTMDCTYKNVGGHCYGVAVHTDNTVYATDYSNHTIKVFKPDGTESQIGCSDKNGGQLCCPWGITFIDDILYVASYVNNTIAMYSTNGRFIGSFGGKGTGNGQLSYPTGICTDGKGRLLVADYGNKRIQVFTSQGNFINSIPCSTGPYDVAVDPVGNIHVALYKYSHIAVYGSHNEQQPIETYNLGGILQHPTAIHIDSDGYRFIGTATGVVYITDPTGTLIATRQIRNSNLLGVTSDKNGLIYVAEYTNNRVSVY